MATDSTKFRSFRYLTDPLFLAVLVLYFVNRLVFKRMISGGFIHNHLNDLLCIPFWVPIMLWIMRRLRMRWHDRPPMLAEVVIPLTIWSAMFEIFLPRINMPGEQPFVADPADVLWYAVGALLAVVFWHYWYRMERRASVPLHPVR